MVQFCDSAKRTAFPFCLKREREEGEERRLGAGGLIELYVPHFSLPSPHPETLLLFLFLPPSAALHHPRVTQRSWDGGSGTALCCSLPTSLPSLPLPLLFNLVVFSFSFSRPFFPTSHPILAVLAAAIRDPTTERKIDTEICSTLFLLLRVFCCWASPTSFLYHPPFFNFFFHSSSLRVAAVLFLVFFQPCCLMLFSNSLFLLSPY